MTDQEVLGLLKPYQRNAVQTLYELSKKYQATADLSDTGVGKTWIAAALLRLLNRKSLVVCPKIAVSHWRHVLAEIGVSAEVINYEKLIRGTEYYDPHGVTMWRSGAWDIGQVQAIVWDEAHRCKGRQTKATKALLTAVRAGIFNHLISASLIQEPLDCRAIGEALGLFPKGYWSKWLESKGYKVTEWGWDWRVSAAERSRVLKQINQLISNRSVRIRWTDVEGFPERYVHWRLVDLPKTERDRIDEALALVESNTTLETILRFRQAVERAKIPAYADMINSYVEQGVSVACWMEWLDCLDELFQQVPRCGMITGDTPQSKREELVRQFQSNELPVLLLQTKVGGASLSLGDETGQARRVGLISPTWSARDLLQVLGRLHRVNAKSPATYYILYAARTVEESVCKKVGAKLVRLQVSTDGGLTDLDLIPDCLLEKVMSQRLCTV